MWPDVIPLDSKKESSRRDTSQLSRIGYVALDGRADLVFSAVGGLTIETDFSCLLHEGSILYLQD